MAEDVTLKLSTLDEADVRVVEVTGEEAISQPFSYVVIFQAASNRRVVEDHAGDILGGDATLALSPEQKLYGMVKELELLATAESEHPHYRAVIVPHVWTTSQNRCFRAFQVTSVVDIVRWVLQNDGYTEGDDFALPTADQPVREYCMQYAESDFAFASRLLEDAGLPYCFVHGQGDDGTARDRLVVTIDNTGFAAPEDVQELPYFVGPGSAPPGGAITELTRRQRAVPSGVSITDYHWLTPQLAVRADADTGGTGGTVHYVETIRTHGEKQALADTRAQELAAESEVYAGKTNARALRAGTRFGVADHFLEGLNRQYLVVSSRVRVVQGHHEGDAQGGSENTPYTATFTAIPASVVYRPPRVTPKPRVHGLIQARILGDANGMAAPVDRHGRYRLTFPWQLDDDTPSFESCWVRRAQSLAVPGGGIHFPLRQGAEVLVAFLDGNVDRPIIVGAAGDALAVSPVTSGNATANVIQTVSGIRMVLEDNA